MKDFLGRELAVGDTVAFGVYRNGRSLGRAGTVTGFNKYAWGETVKIDPLAGLEPAPGLEREGVEVVKVASAKVSKKGASK